MLILGFGCSFSPLQASWKLLVAETKPTGIQIPRCINFAAAVKLRPIIDFSMTCEKEFSPTAAF